MCTCTYYVFSWLTDVCRYSMSVCESCLIVCVVRFSMCVQETILYLWDYYMEYIIIAIDTKANLVLKSQFWQASLLLV